MKVAIRVDASAQAGTGHVMRCLTLADGLKHQGAQVRFVSRELPQHIADLLVANGHEVAFNRSPETSVASDLAHAHWLATSQENDARDTLEALADCTWDWVVVDHYALDFRWESALRKITGRLMAIDDIADRTHDCDLLLDQNFYTDMAQRYSGKVPAQCRLLLGPRHALLRDEFVQMRDQARVRSGPVRRILIFFGGVDLGNFTLPAVRAVAALGLPDLAVDVVVGTQNPFRKELEEICAEHGFVCHIQTERMAELIAEADLGLGAAGATTWERCCLGLPTLAVCVADNQRQLLLDAAVAGLLCGPRLEGNLASALELHVRALVDNDAFRVLISRASLNLVDARGVARVIAGMNCGQVEIRPATASDSDKLYEWRNHPSIRAVSNNPAPIALENHRTWLAAILSNPERVLLIGQRAGSPVGVVRFDICDDEAEVSIYLVPGINMPGLGSSLLRSAESWLAQQRPSVRRIIANVLPGNERSERLFAGSGYHSKGTRFSKTYQEK